MTRLKRGLWFAMWFTIGFAFVFWATAPIVAEFVGGWR